ncbi:MAG: peptidoglycan DD-metalloendopeptidase family protein [bacterium]|nr:peptidoglycan DD-metalloendopeptidase family protein [bacterium]
MRTILIFLLLVSFLLPKNLLAQVQTTEVLELSEQVRQKRQERQKLEQEAAKLRRDIEDKQREAASLENQISIIDNRVEATEADISAKKAEIEERNLILKELEEKIRRREEDITQAKKQISAFLLTLHQYDERGTLALLLAYRSFSEFFDRTKFLEQLQSSIQRSLNQVQELKKQSELEKRGVERERDALATAKKELEQEKQSLAEQQGTKTYLLGETRESEQRYQTLLAAAKQEQNAAQADLQSLEKSLREKFAGQLPSGVASVGKLLWPVDPSRGITAFFHDPSYPFRTIFEHPAIDIRASQGTALRSADGGYVARAHDAGLGYSYIMVIHDNGISTVYGHVSRINVKEGEIVAQGQVIGASGGFPGTPGAGRLTTGSHLHFEVRLNGIPVNPLEYLP